MLEEKIIRKVLGEAAGRGGEVAELFVEARKSTSLRLDAGRVEDVSSGRDSGAGIRVIAGERSSYAYTNLLTEEALLEAARAARAGLNEGPTPIADLRKVKPSGVHPVKVAPSDVDSSSKAGALFDADQAAREGRSEVAQVMASYAEVEQTVLVATSDGLLAADDRTRVRFAVQVVASRDGEIATGFEAPGHSGGFELLEKHPPKVLAEKAAAKAIRMLDARPAPAGEFPVVLAPGTGGVLIHEACGHGLKADTLVKEASVYANRHGERFGSDKVTIVDDGTDAGA